MLPLADPETLDDLPSALVGLVGVLKEATSLGTRRPVIPAARDWARDVLSKVRQHLRENSLLLSSLGKSAPLPAGMLRPIAACHDMLRRLSHELCDRLRDHDLPGMRLVARTLLAFILHHGPRERRLYSQVVHGLDETAARRFADVLFDGMIGDLTAAGAGTALRNSVVDLYFFSIRTIRHNACSSKSGRLEVEYDHPCR